jgi:amidase
MPHLFERFELLGDVVHLPGMTIDLLPTTDDFAFLDATAQAELVSARQVKPIELVDATIDRIERLNPQLNAVVTEMFESARDTALAGPLGGPFAGVPFVLKDLAVEYAGVRFTEGSRFLRDNVSTHDQELTARLKRAGLVIVGKTNTCEFGMRPTCEPVLFGATRNPWDTTRTPGGSSGGSAAAVASGMVPMGHGNDAGGSLRYPASCCGLFALKPTRARVPLGPEYGDVFSGLAVEHALTRTVRDSAALLDAVAGPDLGDPYAAPALDRPFADEVGATPGTLRVAFWPTGLGDSALHPDCEAAVRAAAALCESLGHQVTEAAPPVLARPELGQAMEAVYGGAVAWILEYWVHKLGREPEEDEIEPLTREYWEAGRNVTAAEYLLGVGELQRASREVARFLTEHDVWLTPTLAQPPLRINEPGADPAAVAAREAAFIATPSAIANITGNPAMSVPLHSDGDGLPIGVDFLARFGDEATLIRLAGQLEQARPWAHRRPRSAT